MLVQLPDAGSVVAVARDTQKFGVPKAGTPLNITFGQDIYNNSFDFASFPGVRWLCSNDAEQTSFACADLSQNHFQKINFTQCDLSYVNATNSVFGGAFPLEDDFFSFKECSLAYGDFSGSTFHGVPGTTFAFDQCDLTGANFSNCTFIDCEFVGCNFIGANFAGATFIGCTWTNPFAGSGPDVTISLTMIFDDTTVWPAGFDTSVFPATRSTPWDFSNQSLSGIDLSWYNLGHANFENAVLNNVHLPGNCCWANFKGAQLLGWTFGTAPNDGHTFNPTSYPNLCWADLSDATIDFGPLPSESHSGGIVLAITSHANFSNVQFIWSGASSFPGNRTCIFKDANHAYTNFNGVRRPDGCLLVWVESNCAWCTFVGAVLGPTDSVVPGLDDIMTNDSNMCYCDFSNSRGGWYGMCDLSNAKFTNANIMHSSFSEALLSYADLSTAQAQPICFQAGSPLNPTNPTSLPAFINSATKLPSGVSPSDVAFAVTGQNDTREQSTDGHEDFSFQTIDPNAVNESHHLGAFGADFNHAHFLGQPYLAIEAYNANFQDSTFESGFYLSNQSGTSSTPAGFATLTIPGAVALESICFAPYTDLGAVWYIADSQRPNVYVVTSDRIVQATITMATSGFCTGITTDGHRYVYVVVNGTLMVIDNRLTLWGAVVPGNTVTGLSGPGYPTIGPLGGGHPPDVYLPNTASSAHAVYHFNFPFDSIHPLHVVDTIAAPVGAGTISAVATPDRTHVYALGEQVFVIRTADDVIVADIPVGFTGFDGATGIVITPAGDHVFAQDGFGLSVISTASNTVVAHLASVGQPLGISSSGKYLFIASGPDQLQVLSIPSAIAGTTSVVTTLTLTSSTNYAQGYANALFPDEGGIFPGESDPHIAWVTNGTDTITEISTGVDSAGGNSDSYQSHWGATPISAALRGSSPGIGQPPKSRKPDVILAKGQSSKAQSFSQ